MFPVFSPTPSRNLAASLSTVQSCSSLSPKPPFRKLPSSRAKPTAARTASWLRNTFEPMPISPGPLRKSPSWAPKARSTSSTNANSTKLLNPSAKNSVRKKSPNFATVSPIPSSPPSAATSPRSSDRGPSLTLFQQILLQEPDRCVELKILIRLFSVPAAFILRNQEPYRSLLLLQRICDLLRLGLRHPRIVLPGNLKHRFLDFVDVIHRRYFFQELPHLRIPLVAVFHAPQIPPVRLRVLEERHQVRHAHDVHRAANPVAVKCRNRQRHVSAVTSAGYRDPLAIQTRLRRDPVEQSVDVLVGVLALEPIVQQRERLPVSRGPAHIRVDQRDPHLIQ